MKLPKRIETHIIETASWKILQATVPSTWILRQVSERDYGIDCYIELVNSDQEITGELLSGQLKGTQSIEWTSDEVSSSHGTFSGISTSTINYWMRLPVPVFLFVADISQEALYFSSVKRQVRKNYNKFLTQQSMSFELIKICNLGSSDGQAAFVYMYFMEKRYDQFKSDIRMLFVHFRKYIEFIEYNQDLDCFMEVENEDELIFIHIYNTLERLCSFLFITWDIEDLRSIITNDRAQWKDSYCLFHNLTLTKILPLLHQKVLTVIEKTKKLVTITEKEYWMKTDLVLFNIIDNFDNKMKA